MEIFFKEYVTLEHLPTDSVSTALQILLDLIFDIEGHASTEQSAHQTDRQFVMSLVIWRLVNRRQAHSIYGAGGAAIGQVLREGTSGGLVYRCCVLGFFDLGSHSIL